jgi:hypothetical protein
MRPAPEPVPPLSPRAAARGAWLARLVSLGLAVHAAFLPISIPGVQIGLGTAVVGLVALAASGRRAWSPTVLAVPVAVLCAGALAALAIPWAAGLPPLHAGDFLFWRGFAAPLAVVLALEAGAGGGADAEAPRRRALAFVAIWAAAAIVPACVTWLQVRTGFDPQYALGLHRAPRRIPAPSAPGRFAATGFFASYIRLSYAMLIAASFAGALAFLAQLRARWRVLFGASALAAAASVALSGSRAAWAALAVAAVTLALLGGSRASRVAAPVVLLVALASGLLAPGLRARLSRLESVESFEAVNGDRAMTWRVCRELVREHPLTGVGFNALPQRIDAYFERFAPVGTTRDRCHDLLYSAWAEGGPLFAGAVAAWWLLLLRGFRRLRRGADALGRAATAGVLAGLAAMFVMSLVHDTLWASEAAFGLGALLGAGEVLARPRGGDTPS